MELLEAPLRTAEFLVIDTETNGLSGDQCELTEVGTVLVGGGELHDRFSSLLRTNMPLRRGIQRFTGITQAMVDSAPPIDTVLPELAVQLNDRVMVAHNAPFDRRVLRQAFERIGLQWPNPPVICTAQLARQLLPLQRRRGLKTLAEALNIEVEQSHRALPDAETCARVLCALFPRLCANAITIREALTLLRPKRPRRPKQPERYPAHLKNIRDLDFKDLPKDPGVYLFRDQSGRTLYVGKSISIRSRARAHFAPSSVPADWTAHAAALDYRPTRSELGALVLENRLIKQLKPPGNRRLTRTGQPARLHPLPARHRVPDPRGLARSSPRSQHHDRAAQRAQAGARAGRAARQPVRPASLRPAPTTPRAPVRLRSDGPLPVAMPGRSGPEPIPPPARRGAGPVRRRRRPRGRADARRTSTPRCGRRRKRRNTSARSGCGAAPVG